MRRTLLAGLGLAVAALAVPTLGVLDRTGPSPGDAGGADKQRLTYVVVPHPDDEWSAWAMVQQAPESYHVFILLTRGEGTGYCEGGGWSPQHAERRPEPRASTPTGFGAVLSEECKAQRVDAWETWLDRQALHDPNLGTGAGMTRFRLEHEVGEGDERPLNKGKPAAYADWQVGTQSARVVFDLGDGPLPDGTPDLTEGETSWAIQAVRRDRHRLPDLPESDIVGAAYYSTHPSCYAYAHADHLSVHRALERDQGVPGEQWVATCKHDPRAERELTITDEVYDANMAPRTSTPGDDPASARTGHFQQVYGWLAFDPGGYWPSGTDNDVLFSQSQAFWRRR